MGTRIINGTEKPMQIKGLQMTKKLSVILISAFIFTSCIELAVGTAVVATGAYVAKQGEMSSFYERNVDSSWELTSDYASTLGDITYSSQNEGIIKVDYAEGGSGKFSVERVTVKTTKVILKSYHYGLPSNTLTESVYPPLAKKLQ